VHELRWEVALSDAAPLTVASDLLSVPFTGEPPAAADALTERAKARLAALAADLKPEQGQIGILHLAPDEGAGASRIALVGVGRRDEVDGDAVRTAAAAAARAGVALGNGIVAWAFADLPLQAAEQVRAVVEGALLGAHDAARWKTEVGDARTPRLVLAGAPAELDAVAARAEVVARWTNRARELVDGPPNEVTPAGLAEAATRLLAPVGVAVDVLGPAEIEQLGLGGLAAVGRGSVNAPCLIVLRSGAGAAEVAFVGKAVTFDSGGFFLKGQGDIVKQKADMGGGAAVLAAVGASAELGLPAPFLGVIPAAENMLGGAAFRPGDIISTAAGLTVEVTNPDAEGRLLLADALWYARERGATRLVDVATLTGAVRAALGDRWIGVFGNDDGWRDRVVAAGNAAGDYAWPMPLHRRYRKLLDSSLADLRNTSGRSFGYPVTAAAFLERFVGGLPWAHLDIHSTAFLDEERDYLARCATGAGVRLLVQLATELGVEAKAD